MRKKFGTGGVNHLYHLLSLILCLEPSPYPGDGVGGLNPPPPNCLMTRKNVTQFEYKKMYVFFFCV